MTHTASPAPATAIPPGILCAADYEALAVRCIDAPTLAYIAGGSGAETTLSANLRAFAQWQIRPRVLCDVSAGHTRVRVLGRAWAHPAMLAPVGWQRLVHPGGECDTARGAAAAGACFVASTLASASLEAIAAAGEGEQWFQLYFQAQRSVTLDLVRRAEAAGYRALVVTLDAPVSSPGRRAQRAGFRVPDGVQAENLRRYRAPDLPALAPEQSRIFQGAMRAAPTWEDLHWLLTATTLPVVVKGVLSADDACALRAAGVAALVVSNHGGRALDGVPPSLTALREIRAALGAGYPLLFDSGIRSGDDIFKALALGADAVMVGRLQAYALAVAGALGVAHMLRLLCEELELCMALAGCATVADIGAHCVSEARPC